MKIAILKGKKNEHFRATTPGLVRPEAPSPPQGQFCCGKSEPEALRRRLSLEAAVKRLGELLFELLACQLYCHKNTSGRRRRSRCQQMNAAAGDTSPNSSSSGCGVKKMLHVYVGFFFFLPGRASARRNTTIAFPTDTCADPGK